ncbi:MAG: hypothetical protein U1A72_23245 [Sulfuritalea sp.]|nr:hypothetical protein [Sulfuritalea sp.]
MYGLPGSPIQFGVKRAKRKLGRKSAQAQFLEQQKDLFPVDLYTSKLSAARKGASLNGDRAAAFQAAGPQRSEDRTACAVAVPAVGTVAATRARAPALGKTIRTLRSTPEVDGGNGA